MSRVLIVEDSSTQRQVLSQVLQEQKFAVAVAQNGVEALEKIERFLPDVVLLDVVMPDLNGYEVCRRLKSNEKTRHIPVIMCSSKDTQVDVYWAKKNGADAYIVKPFRPDNLLSTIQEVIESMSSAGSAKELV